MAKKKQAGDFNPGVVDAGNGGVNAKVGSKTTYFPSVRAAATGESLGLGSALELQYDYVDWNGHRYVYGDDVIRVARKGFERHIGLQRYGNEFHRFLVAVALSELGVGAKAPEHVDLVLFSPPGLYNKVAPTIRREFEKNPAEIQRKGHKQPHRIIYNSVQVWPEGLAAAAAIMLDAKGNIANEALFNGDVVVLDLGVYTADAVLLSDGDFNPETLQHATWENGGMNSHLREPLLRDVQRISSDLRMATVDDIDLAFRNGAKVKVGGFEADIKGALADYGERYAEWLANNILDGQFNGLNGIQQLILVGGGAEIVESHLRKWYNDKVFDRSKDKQARHIHPVDMNMVGGYRLALATQ